MAADGEDYAFTLAGCAFTRGFALTGTGRYDPSRDRFVFEVTTTGRWQCDVRYTRSGERTRVTGTCDGKQVNR
jgi:hypothetical protein